MGVRFEDFFIAGASASAAILGLLVVALTVVNTDDADLATWDLRTVLAGGAFVVLVDIFFVSLVALTGGASVLGLAGSDSFALGLVRRSPGCAVYPRADDF